MLGRKTDQSSFNQVVIMVLDGSRFSGTVQDLVARKVQALVDRNPARYELSRNVFPVEYGASGFIVADCKENVHVSGTMYSAYLFTKFRGLLLGIFLVTRSATTLDNAADILRHISFDSDQTNAECLVGDNPLTGRIVGVVGR